jgi:hypothetical protein
MIGLKIDSKFFCLASNSSACEFGFYSIHLMASSTAVSTEFFSSDENLSFNLSSLSVFLIE